MAQAGETLFDRVLCVAGALAFSQMPEFMQQYLQRLGGHLDEARRHLQEFQNVANQSGVTLDKLITNTRASADAVMVRLGDVIAGTSERVHELASAEAALRNASPFTRPFVFLRHLDHDIASSAWTVFKPAVPTTFEGALYAAAGIVVFLSFYHGCVKIPARHAWRRYQERRAVRTEPIAWRG